MTTSIPFIEETREHVELINACARIYGRAELSESDLAVYIRAIGAHDVQDIIYAVKGCLYGGNCFPLPAMIGSRIYRKKSQGLNDEEKRAIRAQMWRAATVGEPQS